MENHYNCIYLYINKINNKKYVGQTNNFYRRHKNHTNINNNKYPIDRALNKYGEENFEIIILKENLETQCLLNLWEMYYINKYECLSKNGYNISSGGNNGNPLAGKSEEEILKINKKKSNALIGKKKSEKHKENIRKSKIGNQNAKGRITTSEWIEKQRKSQHTKKVYQYNLDNILIKVWESAHEIQRELGFSQSKISECCRKKRKTAYKFIWKFEND